MNQTFWKNKRVLITGHTGFKGSWLSRWLQLMGAQLTGYALTPPTKPSLFDLAGIGRGMQSIHANILDLPALQHVMRDCRPEIVFHLAAQSLVRASYTNPVETYATNVLGTVHLLEAVRNQPGVKAVVNITSDKCYENREWLWGYRENEGLGGYDPYSNSKGCAELVSSAYRSSFFNADSYLLHGVALATARAGNVIGGGDWAHDRLIPDILSAIESGRVIHIRNPNALRPWQHVLEPLRGYLMLAEQLYDKGSAFAEAWNFGPMVDDIKPVSWIVKEMIKRWGRDVKWQIDEGECFHEATYLKLDISKAEHRLNWRPILTLNEALTLIIDWCRLRQAGKDICNLLDTQIHAYQACINQ